jgi:ribosomal protein S18 acetylase RimI-like enzyme
VIHGIRASAESFLQPDNSCVKGSQFGFVEKECAAYTAHSFYESDRVESIITIRQANKSDVDSISDILASSFGALFRAEYGLRQAEVASLLTSLYQHDALPIEKVWVAELNGNVSGILILSLPQQAGSTSKKKGACPQWPIIRKQLGFRRALRAAIGTSLMRYYFAGRTPASGEAYVDVLAVDESARRNGMGMELIVHACQLAKNTGCREISLHVLSVREGARRLYDRCGFTPIPERRIMARIMDAVTSCVERLCPRSKGSQRSILMVRALTDK